MKTIQRKEKPGYSGTGLKFLISTLAIAATICFWNLFSNKDSSAALSAQLKSPFAQAIGAVTLSLPPLPTLVPIQNSLRVGSSAPAATEQSPSLSLRNVRIPAAQTSGMGQSKSVFEFIPMGSPVGSPGGISVGNGGGGTTSTGSSR